MGTRKDRVFPLGLGEPECKEGGLQSVQEDEVLVLAREGHHGDGVGEDRAEGLHVTLLNPQNPSQCLDLDVDRGGPNFEAGLVADLVAIFATRVSHFSSLFFSFLLETGRRDGPSNPGNPDKIVRLRDNVEPAIVLPP